MIKRLFYNIGSNVAVLIVRVVMTFIMLPIYLRVLGDYDYGVWEILAALIGYMGILDIGIKPTVARYISKYHAIEDGSSVRRVFSTAILFMFLMGLAAALLLISGGYIWLEFQVNEQERLRYLLLLLVIAWQLLFQLPSLVVDGAFEGLQRYTLKNTLLVIKGIVVTTAVYNLIELYDGLMVLALISAIGMMLKYVAGMLILRFSVGGNLRFTFIDCSYEVFIESLRFGLKSFVQGIASRVQLGSDRLIIGYFLGPMVVPFYAIPSNLISYIRSLGWTICDVFMPLFSSLDAKNEDDKIRVYYLASSRIIIGILLPIGIGAVLLGGPFIGVWLGVQYEEKTEIILIILVCMTLIPFLNPMSSRYLTALNKHGFLAKLYTYGAVANLILSLIMVQFWGVVGVAVGSLLPVFVIMPLVLIRCCRMHGITVFYYLRECVIPSVLPVSIMFAVVYLYRNYSGLSSYFDLVIALVIGVSVYAPLFFFVILNEKERNWVIGNMRDLIVSH